MVVDCGGGTVDITVHQMSNKKCGHLKELHKATGGPYGSICEFLFSKLKIKSAGICLQLKLLIDHCLSYF